jgi:hypothetical protein
MIERPGLFLLEFFFICLVSKLQNILPTIQCFRFTLLPTIELGKKKQLKYIFVVLLLFCI